MEIREVGRLNAQASIHRQLAQACCKQFLAPPQQGFAHYQSFLGNQHGDFPKRNG